jgi:hypothetical protein
MELVLADRRRLVFATIVTIVALPTLWFTSRDEASDGALSPVAIAVNGRPVAEAARGASPTTTSSPTSVVGDDEPVFMAGPTAPPVPEPAVASPELPAEQASGRATFRRWDGATVTQLRAHPCQTFLAPPGTRLTVTNVNNGRSVRCVNVAAEVPPQNAIIVLHTEGLLAIGELADAPLPVRVTW